MATRVPVWHLGPALTERPALQLSCEAYRDIVRKDPRFIEYFQAATPVNELGRLNIGSRPAKRKASPLCTPERLSLSVLVLRSAAPA
jgi:Phosphoenolpyruvate carboxylase